MTLRDLLPRGYAFTVIGITVGVAGLVSLGAMAERITRFIEGGDRFVLGQISVAGEGMGMGTGFTAGGLLPAAKIAEIAAVPGVSGAQAQVMLPFNTSTSHFLTLTQELIMGMDLSVPMPNRHYRELPWLGAAASLPAIAESRCWAPISPRHVTCRVGGSMALGGQDFTIVGILDKTFTAPDRFALVSIEDARELWLRRDPLLVQVFGAGSLRKGDLNTGAAVGWRDGEDPDALARRIQASVKGLNVTIPGELSHLLRQSTAFFSALLIGIGGVGLLIGGLSLANTVTAAVFERIRDFGIKRALGATDLDLLGEVLGEGLRVSLWGGAMGVLLALAIGTAVDTRLLRDGQQLFLFSPRLSDIRPRLFRRPGQPWQRATRSLRIARLSPAEAIRRGT